MSIRVTDIFDDLPTVDIVDVGASLIPESPDTSLHYQPLLDAGNARLIGFDGNAELASETSRFLGEGSMVLPYIIGDGSAGVFHENSFPLTSSLYPTNQPLADLFNNLGGLMRTVSTSAVETRRLDDIGEIDDADALFIDAQGAALDILKGASRILESVLVVHVEVEFIELYVGQPLFADVDGFLRGRGLMFHTFYGIGSRALSPIIVGGNVNTGLRQHLWADAVYMPPLLGYGEIADERLWKLAMIMNDVYGSVDVAFAALAEIDRRHGTDWASQLINAGNAPQS